MQSQRFPFDDHKTPSKESVFAPWERQAAAGEPLPDGLDLPNQQAYVALRYLHAAFAAGHLTADQAGEDKRKIVQTLKTAESREETSRKLDAWHIRLIRATEQANTAVRKDPTPENALRLCDVLDGLERQEVTI